MKLFRALRLDSIAWPLRRWHVPVDKGDLVFEVGSGGNPYYRSNILCDADFRDEDHFANLICDRPLVIGMGEKLPFKDDCFDYAIASYVLEHTREPDAFLKELQRVAKRGFIEVPDAFRERFTCVPFHSLEVSNIDNVLHIRKKKGPANDLEIKGLINNKVSLLNNFTAKHPFEFQIRYYWDKDNGGIRYNILNPEYEFDWNKHYHENDTKEFPGIMSTVKKMILKFSRRLLSQNRRNKRLNILDYVQCPNCTTDEFIQDSMKLTCRHCLREYHIRNKNVIDFSRV